MGNATMGAYNMCNQTPLWNPYQGWPDINWLDCIPANRTAGNPIILQIVVLPSLYTQYNFLFIEYVPE